jgi:NADH-quinone oxidoreductase subunit C
MTPAWMEGLKIRCLCRHDFNRTGLAWGLFLSIESLLPAIQALYDAQFFLEDISTLDAMDGFVIVYHLCAYEGPDRAALYVILSHQDPKIPSISLLYSGALWHERETTDFFGIRFKGHPEPKPLLLPEDMTGHPLLKEEKERAPLRDLLDPGKILSRDPDFLYFEETETSEVGGKTDD